MESHQMNTTNHTPGPWNLNVDSVHIRDGVIVQPVTHHMDAQGIADAHLISSAPDLLEALRFLLADYIAIEGDKLTGSSVPIEMARAAILKAEGLK